MPNLKAEKRDISVKLSSIRDRGLIPAEIYGRGMENIHLCLDSKEFARTLKEAGETSIVNISVDGEVIPVLIHDFQKDAITGKFLTVDLHKVKMDEKITVSVPVVFVGESPAVKEQGGILITAMDEIEIEALPGDMPREISVDISRLSEIDSSVYVKDIVVSGKYEIATDSDSVIATVSAPEEEEVVAAPVDVSAIKTEGDTKKAERDSKKASEEE